MWQKRRNQKRIKVKLKIEGMVLKVQDGGKRMTELSEIDLDLIDDPAVDIRTDIDLENLEDLATSISNVGLIQPIVVFRKSDRYEVVVGHRRTKACRIAGLQKITAIVREIKPDEIDTMKLDENVFREDVSPIQIGRYIARIMNDKDLTTMEVARYFGKTPQWVNTMIRLLDTEDYIQSAVDKGDLSYVAGLELQKIEDPERRMMYTDAAVKGGAHTRVIRSWVEDEKKSIKIDDRRRQQATEAEEDETPKEYKMKCMLCGKMHPVGDLITVQVDVKCYPQLRLLCKQYQDTEI